MLSQGDTLPALLEKGEVSHRYLGRLEVGDVGTCVGLRVKGLGSLGFKV